MNNKHLIRENTFYVERIDLLNLKNKKRKYTNFLNVNDRFEYTGI